MIYNYFATVAPSLEMIALQELEQLGAKEIMPEVSGIRFQGDKKLLYRVNLWARTIFRVLLPIAEVKSFNAEQLYKSVKKIDWENYLQPEQTLAIHCTGSNQHLNHSHFTALQIKNAIIDQQREKFGKRSSVDVQQPDLLINAHIYQNNCILSLDSSGESLHRRGYRAAMGLAPLKETLAAAMLELAQWTPQLALFDPLCGSGTLPLEAALKALNIAPGLFRQRFGFQSWLDFDQALWQDLLREAKESRTSILSAPIIGSDRCAQVIQQAYSNAQACGVSDQVQFIQRELSEVEAPASEGIIICNPPYGKRVGNPQELGSLYKQLGDIFKQRFKGWTAYLLTGNKELSKQVGLKTSRRIPLDNGGLPCTLLKYELY
ncbi:THUMP domain-containing class I SAM-dependent RNA methyltransferase [Gloeothece verrucosa]|uniref:rRNA (Guanine-N(2)-)-methyltransferase n=1 Tax=Gloeothece verrucosa (strain PCC 7822) TaxID=497965 RepID=E0U5P1_GLOV7|nr:class I SAM-dependent RNA methyltransferase [Gloeothece verrucosa]ADN14754.1 rRNA (guanine-N(2)-)-methyltransferase [Gloeothece verrucosa PCC 7822]